MSTVTISQIVPFDADGSWLIKGTVDSNPVHLMRWSFPFNPTELAPATVAQAFMDDWAAMDQLINNLVASVTVAITIPRSTVPVSVVFGNKAACYSLVGYDQVQITATIGGTSYSVIVRQRDLLEQAYALQPVGQNLAKKLANQYVLSGSWLGPFVTAFTGITSTTSSSTTTTTTTTSTTTA